MLNRNELEKYRIGLGFNIWQAERDYLQHLILLFLSKRTAGELIFKGGTALQKAFGLNRFSIDLDFTQSGKLPPNLFALIQNDLSAFGFKNEYAEVKQKNSITLKFKIQGPLYQGQERTLTVLMIEISVRENMLLEPETKEIFPIYADLSPYLIKVMKPEEMLAEKVRAIMTRDKARDVFDLRFLLQKKTALRTKLVEEKLKPYGVKYSKSRLLQEIKNKEKRWQKELSFLVSTVPPFPEAWHEIKERIPEEAK